MDIDVDIDTDIDKKIHTFLHAHAHTHTYTQAYKHTYVHANMCIDLLQHPSRNAHLVTAERPTSPKWHDRPLGRPSNRISPCLIGKRHQVHPDFEHQIFADTIFSVIMS